MSKNMLKSIHRRAIGLSRNDEVMAPKGFTSGGDGTPTVVLESHNTVSHFDDFLGIYLADTGSGGPYYNLHGTDTGGDNSLALLSGASGGVLRMQSPQNFSIGATAAPDMQGIVLGRNFQSSQGRLRVGARVRNSDTGTTPNGISVFVGLTDDTGTTEVPMFVDTGEDNSNANGEIAALAANAVGWLYDTSLDTGSGITSAKWVGVAVAGGTVTTSPVIASSGMVPNVWDTVEVELDRNSPSDTGGSAHFYLNGQKVGVITQPVVASNTKLTPVITLTGHHKHDANVNKIDVDYLAVSAARDTGL
jgi:hypothetical protein